MKANDKARELVQKYLRVISRSEDNPDNEKLIFINIQKAKQCALIAVDEVMKIQPLRSTKLAAKLDRYSESDSAEYWQEVKTEIEKL